MIRKGLEQSLTRAAHEQGRKEADGYSLPGTDGATIEFLKSFSRKATKRREILVVDQNPALIERYRMILDAEVTHLDAYFSDFDPRAIIRGAG